MQGAAYGICAPCLLAGVPAPEPPEPSSSPSSANRNPNIRVMAMRALGGSPLQWSRRRLIAVSVVALLASSAAFVALLNQPKQYFSKTTFELREERIFACILRTLDTYWDPEADFRQLAEARFRSSRVLEDVVRELDLTKAFSKNGTPLSLKSCRQKLADSLLIQTSAKTKMVEIGTWQHDPQLAANIANAVVARFKKGIVDARHWNVERTRAQLRREAEQQRKTMEESKQEMMCIAEYFKIVDPDPEKMSQVILPPGK
jgi:uncharacterized protein involved in exopolysaccharide biosynthesis